MAKIWTKRTINALPSPPAEYGPKNYPDPRFPALSVVVTPKGAKSWSLKYRVAGRQRRLTLGRWPAIDIETARGLAREALTKVAKGGDPHTEKAAARRGEVVDGFLPLLEQYVETWTRPRNVSWVDGARKLGMDLNWYVELQLKEGKDVPLKWHLVDGSVAKRWEKASVHQITKQDIVKALDVAVKEQGPIAANRLLAGLSGLFTWCVGRGVLVASPAKGIPAPAEENVRERELSNTELALIYRAAAAIPAPYSTLAQLWMLLGQRRTETTLMARSQLRLGSADEGFAGQIWRIPAPVAKNGLAHDVPLPRLAVDLLEQLPKSRRLDPSLASHWRADQRLWNDQGSDRRTVEWCDHGRLAGP